MARTRLVLGPLLILAVALGTGSLVFAQSPSEGPEASPGASFALPSFDLCPSPAPSAGLGASPGASVVPLPSEVATASPAASPSLTFDPCASPAPVPGASPGLPVESPLASPAAAASATVKDFEFDPATLTVAVGTTVTWTNEGPSDHTVTADDGAFDSGTIAQGGTFDQTLDAPGTFAYHCTIHPDMKGTVTVQ